MTQQDMSKWLTMDDVSPDDINSVASIRAGSRKESQLDRQLRIAAAMRQAQAPQGQMAGGVYIPPNPLDTAMNLYGKFEGIRDSKNGNQTENDLNASDNASFLQYLRSTFRKKNAQGAQNSNPYGQDDTDLTNAPPGSDL